jgi:PAS domain S-box-containing protein
MSPSTQSVVFNAVPLLVLATAYLVVAASVSPAIWRERARAQPVDLAVVLVFTTLAVLAATLGAVVLRDGRPLGGHVWPTFAVVLVALVPAVLVAVGWRERRLVAAGSLLARAAEVERSLLDREVEAISRLSKALARAVDIEGVSRAFLLEVVELFGVGFAGLSIVSEDGREASGVLALREGEEWPWWRQMRVDLEREPSGIASTVFEAAPLAIFDIAGSLQVSPRLAQAVGARSAAYAPLIAGERVIGVVSLATIDKPRAFTAEELALLQALSAEAATSLDRVRSAAALEEALERERLVSSISRKLRSELELDSVVAVAVEETASALGVERCFVRLNPADGSAPLAAEWRADTLEPIGDTSTQLPVTNLAARQRRTVAVGNVRDAAELDEHGLGSRFALTAIGTNAALATPIIVLDELIGVFTVHRADVSVWAAGEIALVEAVAHEIGLAVRVTRLLAENRERIGQQSALLRAAQVLTGDLELRRVLQRLADQVAELLQADAADCFLLDPTRGVLRCAAVHGLPDDLVGLEVSTDRGLAARVIREGRPLIASDYDELGEQMPHPAYSGFTHAAVAPIRWGDEVQGVLGVGLREGTRRFTRSDADLLGAFAGLASLTLRNAESFAQSNRQARVQRGFYRIASILGQSLSRAATLDAVAQAAAEALGADFAAVLMPDAGQLRLAGRFELPGEVARLLEAGVPEQDALALAADERRVLAASAIESDDRFVEAWRELAAGGLYAALLSTPVEAPRGQGVGLVVVFFEQERAFADDDLELAYHLAEAARGALDRSELFEAERTSRTLAQQLARTGSLLATELDPAAVLDEVVQQAPALLQADACAIRVLDDGELVVAAAAGEGAADSLDTRSPAETGLSGDVVQSRAPNAVPLVPTDRRLEELDPMLAAGYGSYLGVPLVGPEGALHGVLAVYARRPRSWREEEVEALRALAANTSAALSNAELYQRVALEKERSYAILANIADGIVAVDRDGHVVLWNAAAEEITGVPAVEALGRTTVQVLQRQLESERAAAGDRLVSIQRGGEEVWLSLTEAVMRDPVGAVAGRIFAFRDISSDRLVEQMKSDFVSAVSHELRTPLTSIYGFAETLLREDVLFDHDERRTFLRYIGSETQRLTGIVDALLNVARLDSGDLHVTIAPTDVAELVSEVVAGASGEGGNEHTFVVELPEEPLAAEADRDKLRQVFAILLDNAIKYSPEGGTVTVGAKRNEETVEVRVADEGPGIPPSEQERIFRKFYRGADSGGRLAAVGGTGLGLFIAQGLVSAMGGRIWVSSAEGRGSSFEFELPLARVAAGRSGD